MNIKSCAQSHLSSKCQSHNLAITEICPIPDCKNIFLCRLCKRDHQTDHLSQTYYLKEIFEDSSGIFSRLSDINSINMNMIAWVENEIGFQFDEIRVQVDKIINDIQEKTIKRLRSKLPLIPSSLELQEHFVRFISTEPGKYSPEAAKFIASYHECSQKFEKKEEAPVSNLIYPRVILDTDKRLETLQIFLECLKDLDSTINFQVIEPPEIKPFRYYKPAQDMIEEMKRFKDDFIKTHKEEMRKELEKQVNIFKEQALDTEKYYSEKLLVTNQELLEIKNLWQQNEKYSEERLSSTKQQYEAIIKELVSSFATKLEEKVRSSNENGPCQNKEEKAPNE